jgi:LuxR family maltose regulon positive regulatory protein
LLVLDDFHVIENPGIHRAMELMLQHLPLTLRVVLIGRTEPPLRLARLRANGEILQIGREDLAFTQSEALQLFQQSLGLDLPPSYVERIWGRTEGWVAGLQLVGTTLRGQNPERVRRFVEDFAGNTHFGEQYLWEEVLRREPEEIRSFLLRTSILDRFTAALCDAVTRTGDARAMIRWCEQDHLFVIPLDGHGSWWRYHHLFAEVLRERLARTVSDGELDALHLRASGWLEENGDIEDAIRHAVAGHGWGRAVGLLDGLCSELFGRDDVVALRSWLEGLPPSVLER